MNSLIQELVNELKSNPSTNTSVTVKIMLESINNSILLGVPNDQILENALVNLADFAEATVNENLKEVIAKFRKLGEKPTQRLQNMAKEAGLSLKVKALKESKLQKDPIFATSITKLQNLLGAVPEFRAIGPVFEELSKFSYDPTVSNTLDQLSVYVNENRAKLEIMSAIYEMRQTGAMLYSKAVSELENCLLENQLGADTIKMKLRGTVEMPIVNRLINTLSMFEAKTLGKFNIGLGNGDAKVKSVIAPFCKLNESAALIMVENKIIKITETADPVQINPTEVEDREFLAVCEAFAALNFQEKESEIVSTGRRIKVAFSINESGNLILKIIGQQCDDLTKVNTADLFLMEQIDTRARLTTIFNNLDLIVNLEFAKRLVNERLGTDSIVLTINESQIVLEKVGNSPSRVIKKMQGLTFHNYVMENFNYDVSELYQIELEEREMMLRRLAEDKSKAEKDLVKLEASIAQIEEALTDKSLAKETQLQLEDLKVAIERNVVALKNHYIELDQAKKKA